MPGVRRKIATTMPGETVTLVPQSFVAESFRPGNSVVDNPTTWFQVACRGCGARTSPLAGVTRTFRVHPLLPSTFLPVLHIPSPVPFRHNNRAVSQRVFNGRRLHATRPRPGPPRPLPLPRYSPILSFHASSSLLSIFFSPFLPSAFSAVASSSSIFLARFRVPPAGPTILERLATPRECLAFYLLEFRSS